MAAHKKQKTKPTGTTITRAKVLIQKGELPGKVRSGHEKSHMKFICRLAVPAEIINTSHTLIPLTMPVASLTKVRGLFANFHPYAG
jgi:hypothetical protein